MSTPTRPVYRQLMPGLLLGILVIVGLLFLGDFKEVGQQLAGFEWFKFAIAIALAFLNLTLRFLKRAISVHRSGVQKVSFIQSLRIFVASFPLVITPTRIGESYKGIWLYRASGIPVERAVSIYFVDQISDTLSIFVLIIFGTISYPALWPLFAAVLLIFLAATIYLRLKPEHNGKPVKKRRLLFLSHFMPQLRESIDANPALFTTSAMILTFLISILSWAVEGTALFIILVGLGLTPSLTLIATAVLVFAFSTTMGMATRLPGGLGVTDVAMAMMLTLLLNFHPALAVAATLLFRLATFWFSFLLGMLIWSFSGKSLGLDQQEGHIIES